MKKYLNWRNGLVAFVLLGGVALFSFQRGDNRNFQIAKNLDVFNSIVNELALFYVDTLDAQNAIRQGIDNMLYSLDPYTVYYP